MLIYFQAFWSYLLFDIYNNKKIKDNEQSKFTTLLSFYIHKITATNKEVCGILFLKQNSRKDSQFTCVFGPREI
jgi:hypothetical protein